MARRFPLQSLLDHAQHRLDAAERLVRMLKRKEDASRQRLEDFQGYRQEYQNRLTGSGQGGIDIQLLRDYHAFLVKLDAAIRHQEAELSQAQSRTLGAQEAWMEQRKKVKSFETLSNRHATAELKRADRREQLQFDEQASRRFFVDSHGTEKPT